MAINEKVVNTKINNELKKYEILKKAFSKLKEIEAKSSKEHLENYNRILQLQEYDNSDLKEIYNKFSEEMRSLKTDADEHLKKLDNLILPVIELYPEEIRTKKMTLEIYLRDKANKARIPNNNDAKGETLEDKLVKFEIQRGEDNKCLFLHYIYSELKYHAAVVEKLANLFHNINSIKPESQLEVFAKKNNINLKDVKLKINIDEYKKNKEAQAKKEKEKANNVYSDEDEIEDDIEKLEKDESKNNEIKTGLASSGNK